MSYTYTVEPWATTWPELEPHWKAHWDEVAVDKDRITLDLDFEAYAALDAQGLLHLVTVRDDASGAVVGYWLGICRQHLHYRHSMSAYTDVYYLAPAHRRGLVGYRLFQYVEATLRARGVERIFTGTKRHLDMTRLFERLGYTHTENLLQKYIGGP